MTTRIFNEVEVSEVHFNDWIQVVDYVGNIFIDRKWATKNYFEQIKKDMIETKSYMVLAPGVVLLHSAPDKGALHNAFHFLKLKHTVKFNHEHNDPVEFVITFSATDAVSHIESIQRIAYLLMEDAFMNEIKEAEHRVDLIKTITKYENKVSL